MGHSVWEPVWNVGRNGAPNCRAECGLTHCRPVMGHTVVSHLGLTVPDSAGICHTFRVSPKVGCKTGPLCALSDTEIWYNYSSLSTYFPPHMQQTGVKSGPECHSNKKQTTWRVTTTGSCSYLIWQIFTPLSWSPFHINNIQPLQFCLWTTREDPYGDPNGKTAMGCTYAFFKEAQNMHVWFFLPTQHSSFKSAHYGLTWWHFFVGHPVSVQS